MQYAPLEIHGALVTLPLPEKSVRPLDGFWLPGKKRNARLLIFVHGMGGNFYRSNFRKQLFLDAASAKFDVLMFNNRGAEKDVATEQFTDCLEDLDAALAFAKRKGYRHVTLMGTSTGCQKITYHQALRANPLVKALVLTAIGDDYAISRRDLGRTHAHWVAKAKQLVARGKGDTILPRCNGFSALRFLSVADPKSIEAQLFDFAGPMRHYQRVKIPVLALLPEQEQYACIPIHDMAAILQQKSRSRNFACIIVPRGDHSFKNAEPAASRAAYIWLNTLR
jgi:pimeloyl-ACP methyl ester carboxylesterase